VAPHYSPYAVHIGYLFLKQKLTTTEAEALGRVLEERPDSVEAYRQRAKVHKRNGDRTEAIADLSAAIALTPGNAELHLRSRLVNLRICLIDRINR